jgi:hypothetical protein
MRGNGTASTDLKHDQRRQHGQSDGFPEPRASLWCITRAVLPTLSMLAMPPMRGRRLAAVGAHHPRYSYYYSTSRWGGDRGYWGGPLVRQTDLLQ